MSDMCATWSADFAPGRWVLLVPNTAIPVAYVRDKGHRFFEWWMVVAPYYSGHCNSLEGAFKAAQAQCWDGLL